MLQIESFSKLFYSFDSFWDVLFMIINFLIMLLIQSFCIQASTSNCGWQALWRQVWVVMSSVNSIVRRICTTLFIAEISLFVRLINHANLWNYATITTNQCSFVLLDHQTASSIAVFAFIFFKIFLCLGHLVSMCILFGSFFFLCFFLFLFL